MNGFWTLTGLFLKQLIRRKSLWIVFSVLAVMVLMNYFILSEMERALGAGESYDIASRRATSQLQSFGGEIRNYSMVFVLVVSALVAPAARKDGTAQFVLTLSAGRLKMAAAQFTALAAMVSTSLLIIHIGYVAAALKIDAMTGIEAMVSWIFLVLPLLLYAAVIFSFSMTRPAVVTLIVFLVLPYILLGLAEAGINEMAKRLAFAPMVLSRFVDNAAFLFPKIKQIILWPGLTPAMIVKQAPFPDWTWLILQILFSSLFWMILGYWTYRNYDFGSRNLTK
jgi:hypothetical protein